MTLRVAPSSAPQRLEQRFEVVVLGGVDAPADADDRVRVGEGVEVVVAGAGEDTDALA